MKPESFIRGMHERIEKEIYRQGKSKLEVCRACGMSRKTLYRSNYGNMNSLYLARICAYLNVSADYILGIKGENYGRQENVQQEDYRQ